ncbi:MAG: hypothetical protein AAGB12_12430 [Pseudomonadota bacterium]
MWKFNVFLLLIFLQSTLWPDGYAKDLNYQTFYAKEDGRFWAGTEKGLHALIGVKWSKLDTCQELNNSWIYHITEFRNKTFVLLDNGSIWKLNEQENRCSEVLNHYDGITHLISSEHFLYIAQSNKVIQLNYQLEEKQSLWLDSPIRDMNVHDHFLVVGTLKSAFLFSEFSKKFTRFYQKPVTSDFTFSDDLIWFASSNQIVAYSFDKRLVHSHQLDFNPSALHFSAKYQNLYVAGYNRLVEININNFSYNDQRFGCFGRVLDIDRREHQIILGTENGVYYQSQLVHNPKDAICTQYRFLSSDNQGQILSFQEPNGLSKIHINNGRVVEELIQQNYLKGLTYYDIAFAHGFHWLATNQGLLKVDSAGHLIAKFTEKDKLSNQYVIAITELSRQRIALGYQSGGIDIIDIHANNLEHYDKTNNLNTHSILVIKEDPHGSLWVASENHLQVKKANQNFFSNNLFNHKEQLSVTNLVFSNNKIFLGTKRNGVIVLSEKYLQRIDIFANAFSPRSFVSTNILKNQHYVILASEGDLKVYDSKTEKIIHSQHFSSRLFLRDAIANASKNRIIYSSNGQLSYLELDKLRSSISSETKIQTHLGKLIAPSISGEDILNASTEKPLQLVLGNTSNWQDDQIRCRFRSSELNNWQTTPTHIQLKPDLWQWGVYEFQFNCSDKNGYWLKSIQTIPVNFLMRKEWVALMMFLGLASTIAWYAYYQAKLQAKATILKMQEDIADKSSQLANRDKRARFLETSIKHLEQQIAYLQNAVEDISHETANSRASYRILFLEALSDVQRIANIIQSEHQLKGRKQLISHLQYLREKLSDLSSHIVHSSIDNSLPKSLENLALRLHRKYGIDIDVKINEKNRKLNSTVLFFIMKLLEQSIEIALSQKKPEDNEFICVEVLQSSLTIEVSLLFEREPLCFANHLHQSSSVKTAVFCLSTQQCMTKIQLSDYALKLNFIYMDEYLQTDSEKLRAANLTQS